MIKNATFTSVWNGGYEVTTNCKVNTNTREVFDIEKEDREELDCLEKEFVTVDGKDFSCGCALADTEQLNEQTDYWYE